jgi:signal transduction histidine kinase
MCPECRQEDEVEPGPRTEVTWHANELEAMFEAMTDGVCIYDRAGNILRMNTALHKLLGTDAHATHAADSQHKYKALMFPGDENGQLLPREQWPISRILKGEVLKEESAMDIMLCLSDGHEVMLNVSGAPIYDSEGRIGGAIIVLRNVTERRSLEMRTREVLNSLFDMAEVIVQPPGTIESTPLGVKESIPNRVVQRLVELTRNLLGSLNVGIISIEPETGTLHLISVVGISTQQNCQWWLDLKDTTLKRHFNPAVLACLYRDEEVLFDFRVEAFCPFSSCGASILLLVPIHVEAHLIGILGIEQGHKKRKFTAEEIALIRALARLAALVIERERLLHEQALAHANELALREINQCMKELLSITSHELRTPLAVIQGNVQLAIRQLQRLTYQGETQSEFLAKQLELFRTLLERASGQTNRLNRLVSDLLDVSHIHNGKLEMHVFPCDLAVIVNETVQEQRLIAPTRQIHLKITHEGTVPIIANANRIKQVVMNYITNALKYMLQDLPVEVLLEVEGDWARVAVRDEGEGLSEEVRERVWECFYRADKSHVQSGLGLGLHICKMIIQRHQGQVGVQSTAGEGATFWFTLPLAK